MQNFRMFISNKVFQKGDKEFDKEDKEFELFALWFQEMCFIRTSWGHAVLCGMYVKNVVDVVTLIYVSVHLKQQWRIFRTECTLLR